MATCNFPTCQRHPEKNGYCVHHQIYAPGAKSKKSGDSGEKKKPFRRIARRSKKLASKERQYVKLVREMLAESPYCELSTPDCTGIAQGLHHMKGRGIHLMNRKYLKRACNGCNGYVERHPQYAMDRGLSVSRHKKN